jgi:hypothetical protein
LTTPNQKKGRTALLENRTLPFVVKIEKLFFLHHPFTRLFFIVNRDIVNIPNVWRTVKTTSPSVDSTLSSTSVSGSYVGGSEQPKSIKRPWFVFSGTPISPK